MIAFIQDVETKQSLTLRDVKEDQFFINYEGALCQKSSNDSYNYIAREDGTPYAMTCDDADDDEEIKKILPTVIKVEFQ